MGGGEQVSAAISMAVWDGFGQKWRLDLPAACGKSSRALFGSTQSVPISKGVQPTRGRCKK